MNALFNKQMELLARAAILLVYLLFSILIISTNSYAAPPVSEATCKTRWTVTNLTTGMQFGDFTTESGSGTVTLTGGATRINGGGVELVNAGSAVSSHKIRIENSLGTISCLAYNPQINWVTDPTNTNMINGASAITMDNVLVHIPGMPGTPFPIGSLPVTLTTDAVSPIDIEITARMNVTSLPIYGTYTTSLPYEIGVLQSGTNTTTTGSAETFAITALTLTPGAPMDFGQISSGSSGGTIILNTSGVRSVGAGTADVVVDAATGTAGTFTIQGDAGLTFNVSYTDGVLTNTSGGNPLTLSGFTDTTGFPLTGNPDSFSVGATLTFPGETPKGDYSTANPNGVPYKITVNYN